MTDVEPRVGRLQVAREWVRPAAVVLVCIYVTAFVVLNTRTVKVSFVFGSTRASLIWVILLALVAGLAVGVLGSRLRLRRKRR
jgi:uncharacterized integral membrane protein